MQCCSTHQHKCSRYEVHTHVLHMPYTHTHLLQISYATSLAYILQESKLYIYISILKMCRSLTQEIALHIYRELIYLLRENKRVSSIYISLLRKTSAHLSYIYIEMSSARAYEPSRTDVLQVSYRTSVCIQRSPVYTRKSPEWALLSLYVSFGCIASARLVRKREMCGQRDERGETRCLVMT